MSELYEIIQLHTGPVPVQVAKLVDLAGDSSIGNGVGSRIIPWLDKPPINTSLPRHRTIHLVYPNIALNEDAWDFYIQNLAKLMKADIIYDGLTKLFLDEGIFRFGGNKPSGLYSLNLFVNCYKSSAKIAYSKAHQESRRVAGFESLALCLQSPRIIQEISDNSVLELSGLRFGKNQNQVPYIQLVLSDDKPGRYNLRVFCRNENENVHAVRLSILPTRR